MRGRSEISSKTLRRFCVYAVCLGFVAQIAAMRANASAATAILVVAMWTPALATLIAGRASRHIALRHLRSLGWKLWIPALLLGWSFTLLQWALLEAASAARWNQELFPFANGTVTAAGIDLMLGAHSQTPVFFGMNWVLTLLAGSALSVLPALGEEIGWRGVLQPGLEQHMSRFSATLIVGLVWGFWHLPVNAAGLNDPAHPMINALLVFPAVSVLLAFPFAWLRDRSTSIWPAAICHGAGDAILGGSIIVPLSWASDTWSLLGATSAISLPFVVASWRKRHAPAQLRCEDAASGVVS